MTNFVCVYWGDKYSPTYVQKLYNMVKRHTTIDFNFIVFTDHVKLQKMVEGDIEVRQLPHHDYQGWFNKMQLFSPEAKLFGTNLYMDLDVVIMKNIDNFYIHGGGDSFGITRNFNTSTQVFNSSIMKFNNHTATDLIWKPFLADKTRFMRMHGDQDIISELVNRSHLLRLFPDEWTFSYKWFSRTTPRFSKNDWTFELDPNAKVAVFHGKPDPHESEQEWVKDNWR